MSLFSVFKRNAKLALRGNWGTAIGIVAISSGASLLLYVLQTLTLQMFVPPVAADSPFAAQYGIDSETFQQIARTSLAELGISGGFMLLQLLLFAPLNLGMAYWYWQLIQGEPIPLGGVFRYFESGRQYFRAVLLELQLTVRTLLWAGVFFCVPSVLLCGSLLITVQGEENVSRAMLTIASLGTVFSCALFLLAMVLYLALMGKYTLAPYLLCEEDTLPVGKAIRQSAKETKGFRFRLLGFQLTFIGWALLCVFVVPVLAVVPYIYAATTIYARYILERQRAAPPEPTREFDPAMQMQDMADEAPDPSAGDDAE